MNGGFYLSDVSEPFTFASKILQLELLDKDKLLSASLNNRLLSKVEHNALIELLLSKEYTKIYDDMIDAYLITKKYNQYFRFSNKNSFIKRGVYDYHINFGSLIFISFLCEYELFNLIHTYIPFNTESSPNMNTYQSVFNCEDGNCEPVRIYRDTIKNKSFSDILKIFTHKLDLFFYNFMDLFINELLNLTNCQQLSSKEIYECIVPIDSIEHNVNQKYDFIYIDWKNRVENLLLQKCDYIALNVSRFGIKIINDALYRSMHNMRGNNVPYIAEGTGFFSFVFLKRFNSEFSGSCITYSMLEMYIMSRLHINGENIYLVLENQRYPHKHNIWNHVQESLVLDKGVSHWATEFLFSSGLIQMRQVFDPKIKVYNFIKNKKEIFISFIYAIFDSYENYLKPMLRNLAGFYTADVEHFIKKRIDMIKIKLSTDSFTNIIATESKLNDNIIDKLPDKSQDKLPDKSQDKLPDKKSYN